MTNEEMHKINEEARYVDPNVNEKDFRKVVNRLTNEAVVAAETIQVMLLSDLELTPAIVADADRLIQLALRNLYDGVSKLQARIAIGLREEAKMMGEDRVDALVQRIMEVNKKKTKDNQ